MSNKNLVKTAIFILFIGIFVSCSDKNQFTVEGFVKDGYGKQIYFENITTSSIVTLDSTKLDKLGGFKFKQVRPSAPDFYRLRMNNRFINISVDSTETITIQTDTVVFAHNYTLTGSPETEKIKDLTFLQQHTSDAYNKLQKQYDSRQITADEYVEKINEVLDDYKTKALDYIYPNPGSASAYFALFQQINGLLIFDPYDKKDIKAYGAVANVWNQYFPDAIRTKHLVGIYAEALKTIRGKQASELEAKEMNGKDFFDISLPSLDDKEIRLTEVGEGQVILVDFTAYELKESPAHNRSLHTVYDKYRSQGFYIYQVSLDRDRHFWKNAAANLPWTCVIDPTSVYSDIAKKYNITTIPTAFILDRNGEIAERIENFGNLEQLVLKYIK
ncbi:MAG: AhpC/TSA family protein [Candidatus Symbiothrix sp.]|jgi:peroxiredoxin|nr:AhpC/TSA family protein [Candidatus Symbiothrix sp.]